MPSRVRSESHIIQTTTVSHPSDIDPSILLSLRHHAGPANIVLPCIENALVKERNNIGSPDDVFWIICRTHTGSNNTTFDFLLSSTDNVIGKYPIFIHCTRPANKIDENWLRPRVTALVGELLRRADLRRVFSVFALEAVTRMFADIWFQHTEISVEPVPYYEAMFTFCTPQSFRDRQMSIGDDFAMEFRRANINDLASVASLGYGFASTSEPFLLSEEKALLEAKYLITKCKLWVHELIMPNQTREITSIVAVSRDSEKVSAITKVYTDPKWRKRGYAERLVRYATKELLFNLRKDRVVLYVAHNNPAASTVYSRVGFQGLKGEQDVPGVERWLELGFDRRHVDLGHW